MLGNSIEELTRPTIKGCQEDRSLSENRSLIELFVILILFYQFNYDFFVTFLLYLEARKLYIKHNKTVFDLSSFFLPEFIYKHFS